MTFRRRSTQQPTRRQRLSEEQPPKLSNFTYGSRQSAQMERSGRQPSANRPKTPSTRPGLFWLQRAGLLIFLVALLASTINVLRLSSTAEIITLDQAGNRSYLQPTQVYATAADKILKSSIWNHSKVTVDAAGLSHQMLEQFPELTSVSVTMPLLAHRPLVYVQAAQPALVLNAASGTFIIDTSGKALARLPNSAAAPAGLPYLIDQSGLNVKPKQQALPASDVRFVQIVMAELTAKQFSVASFDLLPASSELDAHLTGQPYLVKFNLQDTNPAGEAGTFLATIGSLKKQNITPAQYVDVRVAGRAYYR